MESPASALAAALQAQAGLADAGSSAPQLPALDAVQYAAIGVGMPPQRLVLVSANLLAPPHAVCMVLCDTAASLAGRAMAHGRITYALCGR